MRLLTLDDGHDSALLNGRGAFETVGVDTWWAVRNFLHIPRHGPLRIPGTSHTAKQLGLEVHVVEGVGNLIVVRLDLTCNVRERCQPESYLMPLPPKSHATRWRYSSKCCLKRVSDSTYPQGGPQDPCRSTYWRLMRVVITGDLSL